MSHKKLCVELFSTYIFATYILSIHQISLWQVFVYPMLLSGVLSIPTVMFEEAAKRLVDIVVVLNGEEVHNAVWVRNYDDCIDIERDDKSHLVVYKNANVSIRIRGKK